MRKKYLSALLFGALLVTSAGTFTSCKDYDDDINNLQTQITANADAIKSLEELVKNGKYVTAVAMEGQVITFTFSDGSTTPITIPEGEKGQTVVVENNELYIDGEPTGIKVAGTATAEAGLVKAENGTWWVLGEDGEYTNTNIPVSGVTVTGSEKDGYTFTIYDANGEKQTVQLPSAASMITSIELKANPTTLVIYKAQFDAEKAKDWKGKATLPVDESYIVSTSTVDVRVNPVSAPATEVDYYITNTENKSFSNITLSASATDIPEGGIDKDDIGSRATYSGNGLFTLAMKQTILSKADGTKLFDANRGEVKYFTGKALAINANNTTRSAYGLTASSKAVDKLTAVQIKDYAGNADEAKLEGDAAKITVDKDKVYTIEGVEAGALYDVYFTVSEKDATNFGVVVDDLARTFKITKRPDYDTEANAFTLVVNTLDVYGNISYATYSIKLSDAVSTEVSYQPITFDLTKLTDTNNNNDFFNVEMSVLKEALGETKWQEWFNAVDLDETTIAFYTDADCKQGEVTLGDSQLTTDNLKSDNETAATEAADLAIIKFNVVKDAGLNANKQYYTKITFNNSASSEVNHIVVPVKFTAPALSDLFEIASGYWNAELETITAYFTDYEGGSTAVSLSEYFTNSVSDAKVSALNNTDKLGNTDKTQADLFDIKATTTNFSDQTIDFDTTNKGINNGAPANGYGLITKLTVTKDNYAGWAYANDSEKSYSFNIRLMSPIYEGTVNVINGEIELNGNDLENGGKITDAMIKGVDYNKLTYSLMPNTKGEWDKLQIEEVSFDTQSAKYINGITPVEAIDDKDNPVEGHFKVTAKSIESTATDVVKINVKDKWGYVLTKDVNIKIIRN